MIMPWRRQSPPNHQSREYHILYDPIAYRALHITARVWGVLHINSYPPNVTYMRQWIGWVLVQIMACRLFGAKPLSKPMLGYGQLDPWGQTSLKFQSIYIISIHENVFQNIVCGMTAILSRGNELTNIETLWFRVKITIILQTSCLGTPDRKFITIWKICHS